MLLKRSLPLFLLLSGVLLVSGCSHSGAFLASQQTSVELSEANFKIVATNVSGTASVSYAVGASYSFGAVSESFGLIRLNGDEFIYDAAMKNLWQNVEQKLQSVENRTLALVNVRYDSDLTNFILFTKATVVVRADVIEFIQ